MSQFDIGFNTGIKKWFIASFGKSRMPTGNQLVKDSNITLKNVQCDTYAWSDPNPGMSHGRLRFYSGNKITTESYSSLADFINIEGDRSDFGFIEFKNESAVIKYNLPSFDWTITIEGNDYITKDIKGVFSGGLMKEKLRFTLEKSHIFYSNLVTLINPKFKNTKLEELCIE